MADNLVEELRALARYQHANVEVAEEAAEEIERLRERVRLLENYMSYPCISEMKEHTG